jgi:hypothetical protein
MLTKLEGLPGCVVDAGMNQSIYIVPTGRLWNHGYHFAETVEAIESTHNYWWKFIEVALKFIEFEAWLDIDVGGEVKRNASDEYFLKR